MELKLLLKLDADAPIDPALLTSDAPLIPQENQNDEAMQLDNQTTKYRKPSQKQRRNNQLRRGNPQRDSVVLTLADKQIKSAEEMIESGRILSRGQLKRLRKKEKFVTRKTLEKKAQDMKAKVVESQAPTTIKAPKMKSNE